MRKVSRSSVWDEVPDAEVLRGMLLMAKDPSRSGRERLEALSYLSGAVKVMTRLEKRQRLVEYLTAQIRELRPTINY